MIASEATFEDTSVKQKNVSESDQIIQYFPKQLWMIYFEGQPGGSSDKSQLSRLPRLHFRTDPIFLSFIYF